MIHVLEVHNNQPDSGRFRRGCWEESVEPFAWDFLPLDSTTYKTRVAVCFAGRHDVSQNEDERGVRSLRHILIIFLYGPTGLMHYLTALSENRIHHLLETD